MEKKLRRYRGSLVTNGIGIIVFGVWSILKLVLSLVIDPLDLNIAGDEYTTDQLADTIALVIVVIIFIIILTIVLLVHLYVGFSAYKEGIYGKKGSFYLVLVVIMALIDCCTLVLYLLPKDYSTNDSQVQFAAFIIDITTVVVLIDTLYTAIMSRKLAKQLEK